MVEAGANEISEAEILDALDIAHGEIKKICAAQRELAEKAGKPKIEVEVPQVDEACSASSPTQFGEKLSEATSVIDKLERQDATKKVEEEAFEALAGDEAADEYAEKRAGRARWRSTSWRRRPSAAASPSTRSAPTAVPRTRSATIWIEVGVGSPHARLRRVHPRPDAGVLGCRARHHA